MQSKAATVADYLASLPPDRRAALEAVRKVILDNLDKDYAEGMQYGMIGYAVPHSVFPAGYHCDPRQPLPFAALSSQKNHMSLHLMCIYGHQPLREWFETAWKKTGKKLDMGKACLRFKKIDDLALDVIGEAIRRVPAAKYIEHYQQMLAGAKPRNGSSKPARKSALKKSPAKKAAGKQPAARSGKSATKTRKKTTKRSAVR